MKVSYSTLFAQTADEVWAVIRDFNSYPVWVASVAESHIEEGKSGEAVGAIRKLRRIRYAYSPAALGTLGPRPLLYL